MTPEEMARDRDSGIACICSGCGKTFLLAWDKEESKVPSDIPCADMGIHSCDSGGIYASFIDCPHCSHRHDIY